MSCNRNNLQKKEEINTKGQRDKIKRMFPTILSHMHTCTQMWLHKLEEWRFAEPRFVQQGRTRTPPPAKQTDEAIKRPRSKMKPSTSKAQRSVQTMGLNRRRGPDTSGGKAKQQWLYGQISRRCTATVSHPTTKTNRQ